MCQWLKSDYNLNVKCSTILEWMNVIDPEILDRRYHNRLKKRELDGPGLNFTWYVDGFDKLKKFGFAITDCVWSHIGTTIKKPEVTENHFLHPIKAHECLPTIG